MYNQYYSTKNLTCVLIFLLLLFVNANIIAQSKKEPYKWKLVTNNANFSPRDGAGTVVYKKKIWLMGGWNKDSVPNRNSQVWTSTDGENWTLLNPKAPWSGRHCSGWVVYKRKIWLIGGDGNIDVWNTKNGLKWEQVTDSAPWGPRYKPYVFVFHDTLWLMGGFDYFNKRYKTYNDVWFSTNGADWTLAKEHCPWKPRGIIHGSVIFNDKIWILGGGLYGHPVPRNETYYNDVWCSSDCRNWTLVLEHAPWVPRLHHNIEVFDNKMWVMDGHNRKYKNSYGHIRNDVWYSSDGITWTELKNTPWVPTHAASTFIWGNCMYMAAGYLKNKVWKLEKVEIISENSKKMKTKTKHN